MTLGTPSERNERALRDLARGEAQNGIAPGEGLTSHPSHPLDPPLSGSSDEKAIPGRHLKAPRITGMRLISLALFGRWRCLRDAHCTIAHCTNGPITIAIRARFEYDSTTIRLQHATTRYEVFRALAYEIVYENQW